RWGGDGERNIRKSHENKIAHIGNPEGVNVHENYFAVMAAAFSPSGDQVALGTGNGSVWIWDFKTSPPRALGKHTTFGTTRFNRVRAIHFDDENNLHTLAEDGMVKRWTRTPAGWTSADVLQVKMTHAIRSAAFSRQGWVAAVEIGQGVRVVSLDGAFNFYMAVPDDRRPRSIAFSDDGRRIALGLGRDNGGSFRSEGEEEIRLFKIDG